MSADTGERYQGRCGPLVNLEILIKVLHARFYHAHILVTSYANCSVRQISELFGSPLGYQIWKLVARNIADANECCMVVIFFYFCTNIILREHHVHDLRVVTNSNNMTVMQKT